MQQLQNNSGSAGPYTVFPSKYYVFLAASWVCLSSLWRHMTKGKEEGQHSILWRPLPVGPVSADAMMSPGWDCDFFQILKKKIKLMWFGRRNLLNSKNWRWSLSSQPPSGVREARGEKWRWDGWCTCMPVNVSLGHSIQTQ